LAADTDTDIVYSYSISFMHIVDYNVFEMTIFFIFNFVDEFECKCW